MKSYSLTSLLTIAELARKLGISVKTVRDLVYKRKIPFTRFGRRIYLDAGVVEEMLRRNAVCALPISPFPTLAGPGGAQPKSEVQDE